ncbi:MAG: DUF5131 family protein, partial [Romboutsia sp.]|nr:DUF5131 family protein [Romboutsia sp.]
MSKTKKSKNQNEKGETKMENIVQWNPSEGYLKLDEENVNHYYFEKLNDYDWNQEKKFENEIEGELSEYSLFKPYEYKDPKIIRVSTDNDLFFGKISDRFISKIFQIMNDNPQHTFKLRTKYSKRLAEIENYLTWSENIHMGVIVEEEYALERI